MRIEIYHPPRLPDNFIEFEEKAFFLKENRVYRVLPGDDGDASYRLAPVDEQTNADVFLRLYNTGMGRYDVA